MTYVEYKQLTPFQKFAYNFKKFFTNIPSAFGRFFSACGRGIVKFFTGIGKGFANYGSTFVKGDWATKLSYLIFGVGDIHKGKTYKGILFFLTEVLYFCYMIFFGWHWFKDFFTLGTRETYTVYDDMGFPSQVPGDNSMLILLYSTLTLVITAIVFVIYIQNIKDAYRHQVMRANGEKPTTLKEDALEFLDGKYHITLLSFPVLMISVFNILPLIFMILIAFTNYSKQHYVLFDWVGLQNFGDLFDVINNSKKATTFIGVTRLDPYLGDSRDLLQLHPRYDRRFDDQQKGHQAQEPVENPVRNHHRCSPVRIPASYEPDASGERSGEYPA